MKNLSVAARNLCLFTLAIMCVIVVFGLGIYIFCTPKIVGYYPTVEYSCQDAAFLEIKAEVSHGTDFVVAITTNYDTFRGMMYDYGIPMTNQECKDGSR